MPQLLSNNTVAVHYTELVPRFWSDYRSLRRRLNIDDQKGYGIKVIQRGGGKDNKLLIDYDTLPKRYQQKIPDPRVAEHLLEPFYIVDRETQDYYHNYQYPDGSYLLPETIEDLIVNASVLKAAVKLEEARTRERMTKGGTLRGIAKTVFEDVHDFNDYLMQHHGVKHSLNTTYKRFQQQLNAFKEQSYYGIIKDPEGNSKQNAMKRDEETHKLLRNLLAGRETKPSPSQVADEYNAFLAGYIDVINNDTGEVYNPSEYKKLSTRTITSFLSTWESKIGTDAKRSGDRQKLINQYIPYHSFERPVLAGTIISIDDRQPPFEFADGKRMWWYLAIDVASECITAWAYGKTKEELIKNFYRNLVANYQSWGIQLPAEVECESSLNSSFTDTFLKEGAMFEHVNIFRNNARSKIIERFFRDLRYQIEKSRIGWLARPFARDEANQSGPGKKQIIPYDILVKQCLKDIMIWNNMPKKGDTISRFDYFMQNQNPDLVPTNYKSFIQDLGTKQTTSCKAGIVHLQMKEWLLGDNGTIYTGEKLIRLLKQVERKTIDVYYLASDQGDVVKAMVYENGRYICEILPKPKSMRGKKETTEDHAEAKTVMSAYTNTVAAYMRTQKNTIEQVTVINNKPITVSNSFSIEGLEIEESIDIYDEPVIPAEIDEYVTITNQDEFNNDPTDTL